LVYARTVVKLYRPSGLQAVDPYFGLDGADGLPCHRCDAGLRIVRAGSGRLMLVGDLGSGLDVLPPLVGHDLPDVLGNRLKLQMAGRGVVQVEGGDGDRQAAAASTPTMISRLRCSAAF